MTPETRRAHLIALGQALLVTLLWSSSWPLTKLAVKDIPPLTFAGLRYGLATLCLAPVILLGRHRGAIFTLEGADWGRMALLGLVQIALTQGAQVVSLAYLPTTAASLVLSFTPALVALLGGLFLGERILTAQWAGIAVFLTGAGLYFGLHGLEALSGWGLVAALVCLAANAAQALIGRGINRATALPASIVAITSMGIGTILLLTTAVALHGFPRIDLHGWLVIGWLALVNTAFAFILWNRVQRVLTAMESSLINNTIMVPIAVLAVLFLGEQLGWRQVAGLAVALIGVMAVQLPKLMSRPARS